MQQPERPLLEVLAAVRPVAKHHGYAIAVHGSLSRDIDLVAVPWVPITDSAEELVEAVRKAVGGVIIVPADHPRVGQDGYMVRENEQQPEERPHGRLGWSIHLLKWGTYLDISVLPTTKTYDDVSRGEPGSGR